MYRQGYKGQPETLDEAESFYGGFSYDRDYTNQLTDTDKEAWIAALLSGNYEQGRNRLCAKGKYCCLGVLAEVNGVPSEVNGWGHREYYFNNGPSQTGVLGFNWANEKGFASGEGAFVIDFELFGREFHQVNSLANLNDDGLTFSQIADVIRHFF